MVCAWKPQRGIALHSSPADKDILEGVVKRMTHVELSGDVWRRDNDGIGLLLGINLSVEIALFLPVMIDTVLEFLRGVGLCKFLSHCNVVLSFSDIFTR